MLRKMEAEKKSAAFVHYQPEKPEYDESQRSDDESQESDDESEGSNDESQGSDHESQESDDESQGSDDKAQGSDDEAQGSDDEAQGSDDESKGSDHDAQGSNDESQGSDDESQGSDDDSQESDDESQGSDSSSEDDFNHREPSDENRTLISKRKKYLVGEILGRGSYGTVIRGWENGRKDSPVAIKVAKGANSPDAMIEAINLSKIRRCEGANEYLIKMTDMFIYTSEANERISRTCIVLEMMEISLHQYMYNVMKKEYMNLSEIRRVLRDVLNGLVKLKQMGMVHSDLHLDNIMLNGCGSMQTLRAKIIDFGLAHLVAKQEANPIVQILPNRSPEVIMRCLPYSEAIDMWSVGCILGELLVKREIYPGKCAYDQLRYIVENQGRPPRHMIKQGLRSNRYFTESRHHADHFRLKTPEEYLSTRQPGVRKFVGQDKVIYESSHGRMHDATRAYCLFRITSVSLPMQFRVRGDDRQTEAADRREVHRLLKHSLTWDPKKRITAERALQLPFFDLTHLRPCKGRLRDEKYNFYNMAVPIDPAPAPDHPSVTAEVPNEELIGDEESAQVSTIERFPLSSDAEACSSTPSTTPQEIISSNTDASTKQQQQQSTTKEQPLEQPTQYITDQQFVGEHIHGFESPGVLAKALCDYNSDIEGDISFESGDIVSNIDQVDESWWKGLAPSGYFGLFPAKHVKLIE